MIMINTRGAAAFAAAIIALPSAAGAAGTPAHTSSMAMGTVTIPVTAGAYRITLMIGPREAMYTQAQARRTHPTTGEIMLRGTMMVGDVSMGMLNGSVGAC